MWLQVPYHGTDNDDYQGVKGFCCSQGENQVREGGQRSARVAQNENPELYQYYYHADHLGSSSYITNLDGEVAQHIEYVPFGEVFIEERNNTWNTPYLFNGKELDEETGLYYYGARYYNPRVSQWLSVDPIYRDYLSINQYSNILDSKTLGVYSYSYNNPVGYADYEGSIPVPVITGVIGAVANTAFKVYTMYQDGELDLSWKTAGRLGTAAGVGAVAGATGNVALLAGSAVVGEVADQAIKNEVTTMKGLKEDINYGQAAFAGVTTVAGGKMYSAIAKSPLVKGITLPMAERLSPHIAKDVQRYNWDKTTTTFFYKHGTSAVGYINDRMVASFASATSSVTTPIAFPWIKDFYNNNFGLKPKSEGKLRASATGGDLKFEGFGNVELDSEE